MTEPKEPKKTYKPNVEHVDMWKSMESIKILLRNLFGVEQDFYFEKLSEYYDQSLNSDAQNMFTRFFIPEAKRVEEIGKESACFELAVQRVLRRFVLDKFEEELKKVDLYDAEGVSRNVFRISFYKERGYNSIQEILNQYIACLEEMAVSSILPMEVLTKIKNNFNPDITYDTKLISGDSDVFERKSDLGWFSFEKNKFYMLLGDTFLDFYREKIVK